MHISIFGYEVDCEWSQWSSATSCTKTCGIGKQLQARTILTHELNGGSPCTGDNIRETECSDGDCPPGNSWVFIYYQNKLVNIMPYMPNAYLYFRI